MENFEDSCNNVSASDFESEFKLAHPSTILISGPTGSGKTHFVKQLIIRNWFEPSIQRIVWIYGEWQPDYEELKRKFDRNIEFVHNPESYDEVYESLDRVTRNLVVFDDQMNRSKVAGGILKFFTQGSHHRNLSVIYLVQNLFDRSNKEHRTINLNSQYLIIFRNPRDTMQIRALGSQFFGGTSKGAVNCVVRAFQDATKEAFSYLLIDARPQAPKELRFRSNIFDEQPTVYVISEG